MFCGKERGEEQKYREHKPFITLISA